jgi:hypothetical protein
MSTPKDNKDKLDRIINAWQTLTPTKKFAGMSLDEFKAAVKPSYDTREELRSLKEQVNAKQAERDHVDEESLTKAQMVVNAVLADSAEGPDSPLYEGFGYKRKSEKKSGLTRNRKKTNKSDS